MSDKDKIQEIKIKYTIAKKGNEGWNPESMVFSLKDIEENDEEWIFEQFELAHGCDGNCTNESVNHCECEPIFEDFEIIKRELEQAHKEASKDSEILDWIDTANNKSKIDRIEFFGSGFKHELWCFGENEENEASNIRDLITKAMKKVNNE